jgi:hypothetical protein
MMLAKPVSKWSLRQRKTKISVAIYRADRILVNAMTNSGQATVNTISEAHTPAKDPKALPAQHQLALLR